MAQSWSQLKRRMSPAARKRMAARTEQLEAILTLRDLLKARDLTQEVLAERLEVAQGNVSRTLRRDDPHVSTLRAVIEAMGGELQLVARFPDATYAIAAEDPAR